MPIRITCVHKSPGDHDDPHEALSTFGWREDGTGNTGRTGREEMWRWVANGGHAYVHDPGGRVARVIAETSGRGARSLRTEVDGRPTDHLLALPEC